MAKPRSMGVPPVLAGGVHKDLVVTYDKVIPFKDLHQFEFELVGWLGRYVSTSSIAPLMADSNLQQIKAEAAGATSMRLGEWPMKMHLLWDKLSNAQWYVEGVGFEIIMSAQSRSRFNAQTYRERLLDAAEARAMRQGPPEWKAYFNLDQGGANWLEDAKQGQVLLDQIISETHEVVKEAMPVLENPVGMDFTEFDLGGKTGWEAAKTLLGTLASTAGWKKGRLMKAVSEGWEKADLQIKAVENLIERDPAKLFADVGELAFGKISDMAGPVGQLGSVVIGSFFNIAIANDTARVARARARLYYFFAVGFVAGLAPPGIEEPKPAKKQSRKTLAGLALEYGTWGYGLKLGRMAGARGSYLLQLALLHYAATHNTTNAWNFQNKFNQHWKHPQDYTLRWSRELMVRSMSWQFSRMKYLTR